VVALHSDRTGASSAPSLPVRSRLTAAR
jgi:hypothetical protein